MTVLVTGSNGFLGTRLVDRLLERRRDRVICLVRPASNRSRLEAALSRHQGNFEIRVGSLASVDAAADAIAGVDQIQHLAAALSGSGADMVLNTVVTSRNLLEAASRLQQSPKIVLTSSFALYGVAEMPRGALVSEGSPIERHPEQRDLYSFTKARQERLFWDYRQRHGLPLVVVRPGVIYGPGGTPMSNRVGLRLPGVFLHLGGNNTLPLTYVENCAEALVVAGERCPGDGEVVNVVDDNLPTCAQYLARYRREVEPLRSVRLPYFATSLLARAVDAYHTHSKGQLPAILTPYKAASLWSGNRFDNTRLKELGWRQPVSTEEGLSRTFAWLQEQRRTPMT